MNWKRLAMYAVVLVSVPVVLGASLLSYETLKFSYSTIYDQAKFGRPGRSLHFEFMRDWQGSYAYLFVTSGKRRVGTTLRDKQWKLLIASWNLAKAGKETPPQLAKFMGPFPAFAAAKPTLRIVVHGGDGCAVYDVAPSEISGIDQAFVQVRRGIHGELNVPGKSPGLVVGLRAGFGLIEHLMSPSKYHAANANC